MNENPEILFDDKIFPHLEVNVDCRFCRLANIFVSTAIHTHQKSLPTVNLSDDTDDVTVWWNSIHAFAEGVLGVKLTLTAKMPNLRRGKKKVKRKRTSNDSCVP